MRHYFLIKVDTSTDAHGIASALKEALNSDNEYKGTVRALILDITAPDAIELLDGSDLQPTVSEMIS